MTRKRMLKAIGLIVAIAFLVLGATGWYYSGEIATGALTVDHASRQVDDLTVMSVGDGQVAIAVTRDTDLIDGMWRSNGVYEVEWDGGSAQVGQIIELSNNQVVREFTPGIAPLTIGQAVHLGGRAFSGNPYQAFGVPFAKVTFTSELGDFGAWHVRGDEPTWVIYTHGRAADQGESLRLLASVNELGLNSLVITYRNDEGVPSSESGMYDYGLTEWKELEAAVQYALDHEAKDIVLVGYSMGGGLTANFLYESDLAGDISGAIFDAPMMDFDDVINFAGERRGLPGLLTATGKFVAGLRFGIDWDALDYLSRVDELDVPVLLLHGDQERLIHQRTSQRFADARPDLVTYVPFPAAGHVESWNVDSERYESAVADFLAGLQ